MESLLEDNVVNFNPSHTNRVVGTAIIDIEEADLTNMAAPEDDIGYVSCPFPRLFWLGKGPR